MSLSIEAAATARMRGANISTGRACTNGFMPGLGRPFRPRTWRHRICLVLALSQACGKTQPSTAGLRLRELVAVALPATLRVTGGTLLPGGDIVLWSDDSPELTRVSESGQIRRIAYAANDAPLTVWYDDASGLLRVFSRGARRVVAIDTAGSLVSEYLVKGLPDSARIYSATFVPGHLVIAVRKFATDTIAVVEVDSAGSFSKTLLSVPVRDFSSGVPDSTAEVEVSLAMLGRRTCATLLWAPHKSFCTGNAHDQGLFLQPTGVQYSEFLKAAGAYPPFVAALRPVAVSVGYLQVIADLRSSRRLLLRYDRAGVVRATVSLQDVFGIVAVDSDRNQLITLRDLGVSELAWYEYRATRAGAGQ